MKRVLRLLFILALFCPLQDANAQETSAQGPIYIVQSGDNLWSIAQRFNVTVDALAQANGMTDTSQLASGARLVIPGLTGVTGLLVTYPIPYGESLTSLSRRYQVSTAVLARLNRMTSPAELYAGSNLIVPADEASAEGAPAGETSPESVTASRRVTLSPGQTLLELAVLNASDPWTIATRNAISRTWGILPGDIIRLPGGIVESPGALPDAIIQVEINLLPLTQGKTTVITVATHSPLTLSGALLGHELHFFEVETGKYVALQGVHAMTEAGFYPLALNGVSIDGVSFQFSQRVYVQAGGYPYEAIVGVDPTTLDEAVTRPENEQWAALTAPVTPDKLWDGLFFNPSPFPIETGFPSYFGNRRSYNGSEYSYFHTGLDMYGQVGTEIFAPAPGIVVFADFLTVRGNATVLDHGWGLYTAYMHQSEFKVKVGDRVEPGQVIGLVGGTGRVNGPHLHWEVWVGGVQVNPLDWLLQAYP